MEKNKLDKTYQYYTKIFTEDPELVKIYNKVTYEALFNPVFLQANSKWQSLDELIWKSGFGIMNLMEVENVDMEKWNEYIRKNTEMNTWYEFGKLALIEWMKAQLEANKKKKS